MAHATDSRPISYPHLTRAQAIPGAIGMHVGLAILCFSTVYSSWQRVIFTLPQWGAVLIVAVALLYAGLRPGPRTALRAWVRLLLALGGLMAFRLAYSPSLDSIPRLAEDLPAPLLETYPGIGIIGVAIALVFWGLWASAGGHLPLGIIPFRRSALLAGGLAVGCAVLTYFLLSGPHDLFVSETLGPVLRIVQVTGLSAMLVSIGGGAGGGRAPHVYIALSLIAAFVRNIAFPMPL
jgi:hypothetical protein